jgi:hypothetical protein
MAKKEGNQVNHKLVAAMDTKQMPLFKLAELTMKEERTVKAWIYNERQPDTLTKKRINRILKTKVYEVEE